MAADGSGGWFIGGEFTAINGLPRKYLAALGAVSGDLEAWDPNPGSDSPAHVVDARANAVYVGGSFSEVRGRARKNLAVLDPITGNAQDWNPEIGGSVTTLAVGDRMVLAGGSFYYAGIQSQANLAGIYLLPIPLYLPVLMR